MSNYKRTEDGRIQASFAKRLGIILNQYEEYVPNSESKYELSLCLSILQTLLCNCIELLNELSKADRFYNQFYKSPISKEIWGFDDTSIISNTFNESDLNASKVLRHLRNALSHPTNKTNGRKNYESTGYNSIDGINSTHSIVFISSPDVNSKGNIKLHNTYEDAEKYMKLCGNFPESVNITQVPTGHFVFECGGIKFIRIFKIELPCKNLFDLTNSLINYLTHPIDKEFDGSNFKFKKVA